MHRPLVAPRARPRRGLLPAALALVFLLAVAPGPVAAADPEATPPPVEPGRDGGDPWLEPFTDGELELAADGELSPDCYRSLDPVAVADELLADRYQLGPWPTVALPHDLTWREDPYGDANWRFNLHSLRFVLDLLEAGARTGDSRYSDRAIEITADWVADNPRDGAIADMAWNDHATALRAGVLTCLADRLPWPGWLEDALRLHGRTLADPAFYVERYNHALNQSIALLEVGRVVAKPAWIDLAAERIGTLVASSIDAQGVSNEQSVGYQRYNWQRYTVARGRLSAMGIAVPAAFGRVDRMPELLAYATLPWGVYELLGDTTDGPASPIPGTWAEYAATAGAGGPQPPSPIRRFGAGYLFARSGWGEARAFTDETALTVQWGPGRIAHGHDDGGSLTLASWGARLLLDPGVYAYRGGAYRAYMVGRTAHNVVTVDGLAWRGSSASRLLGTTTTDRLVDIRLRMTGYRDVVHDRRITWSRGLDYLVVEDRLRSDTSRTYRQLWHLPSASRPTVGTRAVRTRRERGNVLIRQLAGDARLRVVTGRTSPIQGWVSLEYGSLRPAPVVEAVRRGRSTRYVTLVVPAAGRPDGSVLSFTTRPGGYVLRVRVGDRIERLIVDGSTVRIVRG